MASGLAARNGGRVGLAALVAILLLGLGLRVGQAWDGRAPVYDAAAYAAIAANLDHGEGFTAGPAATQPSSNYSPGLPLFVAGLYEATGGVHERLARLVLAVIGALAPLFAYLIGRRITVVPAALAGALAVAIYPALVEYQGMLMSEPLAATLLAASVLAIFWAGDGARQSHRASGSCPTEGGLRAVRSLRSRPPSAGHPLARCLLPGALLGALALVRPEYVGVAVLLGAVVFLRGVRRDWRRSLSQAAAMLIAGAVVLAPWTIRNEVALHRFVPVSTGGGQVLFSGAYMPSGGDPERVGAEVVARHPEYFAADAVRRLRLEQILARLAAHRHPGLESDEALSRMGKHLLWEDFSQQPLEYLGFLAAKVGHTWSHGPRAVMREPAWEALHWLLVGFGLLGLAVLAWRRRWEAAVLATVLLAITAVSALLVASPRRVLVMVPLLAPLAGLGVTWAWGELRTRGLSLSR